MSLRNLGCPNFGRRKPDRFVCNDTSLDESTDIPQRTARQAVGAFPIPEIKCQFTADSVSDPFAAARQSARMLSSARRSQVLTVPTGTPNCSASECRLIPSK